ncbi:hypothetical protein BY996DRAFT_6411145 [Phakopsora pachyrhizi]|nr:hypothetical protein BY996DRAFT_6411145 [Phakopsora pachyrhizi]
MRLSISSKSNDKTSISSNNYQHRPLGCPCPGISILINHCYLNPIDENDPIKYSEIVDGLIKCFNLTKSHALLLSLSATKICGLKGALTIAQLGSHGMIEHDASITRFNHSDGDSLNPSPKLINEFLSGLLNPTQATLMDYAIKLSTLRSSCLETMNSKLKFLSGGEVGLTISIFGDGCNTVTSEALRSILLEEKLPENYQRPLKPVTCLDVVKISKRVNKLVKQIDQLNENKGNSKEVGKFEINDKKDVEDRIKDIKKNNLINA